MMKKVILITGASRGIGAATALAAADAGYHVGINYTRDEGAAQAIAEQVRAKGAMAAVLQADISNEAQVLAMFDAVHTQLGALTALVNNAGIILAQARLQDMDATRIQRMLAVNVFGALVCAREAVRRMSTENGGRGGAIVNVSSMAARRLTQRVRGLRSVQGRHRHAHDWFIERSCQPRDPCQRAAPGSY